MRIFIFATAALCALGGALVAGCGSLPNPMARAQEAAQELNTNLRYGRGEIVMESVAPAQRADFAAHHRGWGSKVRIADVELERFHPKGDHDAQVTVRVSWYRPDEGDLRSTTLEQSWRNESGWKLVGEVRVDGDIGLLGEAVIVQGPPRESQPAVQFPTVRLEGAPE